MKKGPGASLKSEPLILSCRADKHGYLRFQARRAGKQYCLCVHREVLNAFRGPNHGMQARHFPDPTRTNNALENLAWGTAADNSRDRWEQGTMRRRRRSRADYWVSMRARGDRNGSRTKPERLVRGAGVSISRLTDAAVRLMRYLSVCHACDQLELAEWFEVNHGTAWYACRGDTWKHVPMQTHPGFESAGAKPRITRGERHGMSRLSDDLVRSMRSRYASGESFPAIAADLGLDKSTVRLAVRGITWSHVK